MQDSREYPASLVLYLRPRGIAKQFLGKRTNTPTIDECQERNLERQDLVRPHSSNPSASNRYSQPTEHFHRLVHTPAGNLRRKFSLHLSCNPKAGRYSFDSIEDSRWG